MAKHLVKLENLICEKNATETQVPLALPTLKIVLTGIEYGYRRDDGCLSFRWVVFGIDEKTTVRNAFGGRF